MKKNNKFKVGITMIVVTMLILVLAIIFITVNSQEGLFSFINSNNCVWSTPLNDGISFTSIQSFKDYYSANSGASNTNLNNLNYRIVNSTLEIQPKLCGG